MVFITDVAKCAANNINNHSIVRFACIHLELRAIFVRAREFDLFFWF